MSNTEYKRLTWVDTFRKYINHYQTMNFRLFQIKDFADDNLKFKENGINLFKLEENTVGKGEIARYEQFLLFPQCFQKACFQGASKGVIVLEWVKPILVQQVCLCAPVKTRISIQVLNVSKGQGKFSDWQYFSPYHGWRCENESLL